MSPENKHQDGAVDKRCRRANKYMLIKLVDLIGEQTSSIFGIAGLLQICLH
jgi:hypothetical protein